MLGAEVTPALRRRGPARRHHRRRPHRLGRPELRRVRAPGHHPAPRRRRQRLRGQGPVRRPGRRSARRTSSPFVAEDNIIAGNVILYGATARRGVPPRRGRRALLRPQQRRDRGRRGRGRPRLRVHDRRPGRRPRARPAATSAPGMSGGVAFVLDPDGTFPARVNPEMVDLEEPRRRRPRLAARPGRAPPRPRPARRSRPRLLDDWDAARRARSSRSCRRTTSGCCSPSGRRSAEGRDPVEAVMAAARGLRARTTDMGDTTGFLKLRPRAAAAGARSPCA